MEKPQILLFDLDGTLLRNDKTLSEYTLEILSKCKECGYITGISTSRGEQNCLSFLRELKFKGDCSKSGTVWRYIRI